MCAPLTDLVGFWFLCLVRMLVARVDFQFLQLGPAKLVLGQHALNRLADEVFRFFGKQFAGGLLLDVSPVCFVFRV